MAKQSPGFYLDDEDLQIHLITPHTERPGGQIRIHYRTSRGRTVRKPFYVDTYDEALERLRPYLTDGGPGLDAITGYDELILTDYPTRTNAREGVVEAGFAERSWTYHPV